MKRADDGRLVLRRSAGGIDWEHYEVQARALRAQALADLGRRLVVLGRALGRRIICIYRAARYGCPASAGYV